jgi:Spy/CpxP family protein refolding chaperone
VNSWKVILATMVIFGAGVVTGGLLVGHLERAAAPHHPSGQGAPRLGQPVSAGGMRVDLLRRVVRELDLTPEQRDRVDKILKESQERTRKVMAPFLREELQRTTAEFRDALSPEQRVRFDELLKEKQQQQQQRAREQRHSQPPAERPETPHTPPTQTNP